MRQTIQSCEQLLPDATKDDNNNIDDWIKLKRPNIDIKNRRYPCCLVWTPIPFISWFIPIIGHIGIAMTDGIVRDFARPYRVARDSKKYGPRWKILPLDPRLAKDGYSGWDRGIEEAALVYSKKPHFFFFSNCHSFVVEALNNMEFNGRSDYTEMELFWLFYHNSVYLDKEKFIRTWMPLVLIILSILLLASIVLTFYF